uniref:Integrin_alpha2 domain-containing protein n=1 Tax=Caenorhabditis japonica TaxID=281687 RepID=A0A8R1INQ3_CAEJA
MLKFVSHVNSTSQETDEELKDNKWEADLQIIKKAELELTGSSTPKIVHYGGKARGESELELEEDIGIMVHHNYTVKNHGPWTVRNVVVKFDWPYQLHSNFGKGKWALYLLDVPTVTTFHTDGKKEVTRCSVQNKYEYVNPVEIKLNTRYSTQETVAGEEKRMRRSVEGGEEDGVVGEAQAATNENHERFSLAKMWSWLTTTRNENGMNIEVVTLVSPEARGRIHETGKQEENRFLEN